jgi:hypothetical protein
MLKEQAAIGHLAAAAPLVQPPLQVPAVQVVDCLSAEPGAGKDELSVHDNSLRGPAGFLASRR